MPRILLLTAASLLFSHAVLNDAQAAELALPKSVQIHGFASQGLINTSANNFFGDSEDGRITGFSRIRHQRLLASFA